MLSKQKAIVAMRTNLIPPYSLSHWCSAMVNDQWVWKQAKKVKEQFFGGRGVLANCSSLSYHNSSVAPNSCDNMVREDEAIRQSISLVVP